MATKSAAAATAVRTLFARSSRPVASIRTASTSSNANSDGNNSSNNSDDSSNKRGRLVLALGAAATGASVYLFSTEDGGSKSGLKAEGEETTAGEVRCFTCHRIKILSRQDV